MRMYYAKVNLNSHIHELHNKQITLQEVMENVERNFNEGLMYEKEIPVLNPETKEFSYETHEFKVREIYSVGKREITGRIGKESHVYVNQENNEKELVRKSVDNIEIVNFYWDMDNEIIMFHTRTRFGHKEFVDAFQHFLNEATKKGKGYKFEVSLLTDNISLENVKQNLKKLKSIKYIEISIIPPNPDDDILEEIEVNKEEYLKRYDEGNITKKINILESSGRKGLNVDSQILTDNFKEISSIHSGLKIETSLNRGYVRIKAIDSKGRIYNTGEKTPMKSTLNLVGDNIIKFAEECKSELARIFTGGL